jgi:hypothetical protein
LFAGTGRRRDRRGYRYRPGVGDLS